MNAFLIAASRSTLKSVRDGDFAYAADTRYATRNTQQHHYSMLYLVALKVGHGLHDYLRSLQRLDCVADIYSQAA